MDNLINVFLHLYCYKLRTMKLTGSIICGLSYNRLTINQSLNVWIIIKIVVHNNNNKNNK